MWLVGYGLLGSSSECSCSVLFDLNCLLGLLLGCLYCLWWVSARVYGVSKSPVSIVLFVFSMLCLLASWNDRGL